jgi:hypothetical protein
VRRSTRQNHGHDHHRLVSQHREPRARRRLRGYSPLLLSNFFSYWDGAGWGFFVNPMTRADTMRGSRELPDIAKNMTWRGLKTP